MHVFVYGTLTDPDRTRAVLGDDFAFVGEATLRGAHRVEGRYPTLAPGGRTRGRLLATDRVHALDAYEGVDRGLYVRVRVPCDVAGVAADEAAVYVGDPGRLDATAAWPGDGDLADRVARHRDEAGLTVR